MYTVRCINSLKVLGLARYRVLYIISLQDLELARVGYNVHSIFPTGSGSGQVQGAVNTFLAGSGAGQVESAVKTFPAGSGAGQGRVQSTYFQQDLELAKVRYRVQCTHSLQDLGQARYMLQ